MKKLTKNFFYQTIFQLTKILIPIITVPVVSGALGPDGVGVYNYTNSVAQYFALAAGLGVMLYGNREIAMAWARKNNVSEKFWEIFFFKAISTLVSLSVYFFFIFFVFKYKIFYLVQSLTIIAVFFDISWFFMGIEDFKKTSMTNLVIQIITFICILAFVHDHDDVLVYTIIQVLGTFLSQFFVWSFIGKYIHFQLPSFKGCISHFKGSVMYFIPQVAIMLYTNLNKTILGITVGSAAVGYYANSLQLNSVFITIITTLDVVLLPYMSGLYAKNNSNRIVQVMNKTINLQLFFSIPIMFGMLTVYDKLIPWFFGNEFLFIKKVIPVVVILIIIKPLGISISRQYLMPIGKIGVYNKSVLLGAAINIILNLILMPFLGFWGVVIATILAETFVTVVRTVSFVKDTNFKFDLKAVLIYFVCGSIMCLLTRFITIAMSNSIFTNVIQVIIAVVIYFGLTVLFKVNPLFHLKKKQ
ncbi:oligosaccharide flippase family protein [Ligilactobacillus pobuzihii]|uniref:oligosaccharide flippase family protein n=1 Tax=Ligilactobacillus pobuzihii TaxID=449659 RepID=UPI0019D04412|nr:oligosaccharide flippase family protein [Ligilactobacillus pobuzihii]